MGPDPTPRRDGKRGAGFPVLRRKFACARGHRWRLRDALRSAPSLDRRVVGQAVRCGCKLRQAEAEGECLREASPVGPAWSGFGTSGGNSEQRWRRCPPVRWDPRVRSARRVRPEPDVWGRKLREADAALAGGATVAEIARKLGVSENTFHRWRARYRGMQAPDATRNRPPKPCFAPSRHRRFCGGSR